MPVHTYTNWNSRSSDKEEQVEPFRKYFFICEGANTETFYFKKIIDMRKELGIHPLIDIRLWEKTEEHKNMSFPKKLVEFAQYQKDIPDNGFDSEHDKMVIVFDGDIFEEKVQGYEELLQTIEETDIAAVSNPGFELFLLLHIENSYEDYIKGHEKEFLTMDEKKSYSYAYKKLHDVTGMNAKKNPDIGNLAENVTVAIEQEKLINEDIHDIRGKVSCNVGRIIDSIINEEPGV
jgi:hypothetical protein